MTELTPRLPCPVCLGVMLQRVGIGPACGRANLLDCPGCNQRTRVVSDRGLRLDVCKHCRGAWFDHHELASIWTPRFDAALARRELDRGDPSLAGMGFADDLLLHSIFFGPDLLSLGAHGLDATASALPEAIASAPEVAAGAFEAIGEAAGEVFKAVVDIVGGILG